MDDATSKTIEDLAKHSVVRLTDGICSFLGRICNPAADELGLLLRDKIAFYRIRNLFTVIHKTQAQLEHLGVKLPRQVSPKMLKDYIEEASWTEDDALQNMWAGLLAAEASSGTGNDDAGIYVNLLKSLTPYEARLVNLIYGDDRIASVNQPIELWSGPVIAPDAFVTENPLTIPRRVLLEVSPTGWNGVVLNHTHDQVVKDPAARRLAFGYLIPILQSLKRHGLIGYFGNFAEDRERFYPTPIGLDFYMRCSGYRVYPLEAYILTRQAWARKQGVDPFTIDPY
jgi:hypothetical protein